MLKGLIRFALIWALTMFLTPYVNRFFDRLAERSRPGSFFQQVLLELSSSSSDMLVRSLGETVGDLVFGSKG